MQKYLLNLTLAAAVTAGFAVNANAQATTTTTTTTTQKEVVRNPDGTYSVIEYPVNKEVTVELMPSNMNGAKGSAKIMRMNDGTKVMLDLSGLPADASNYYVYALDNMGKVSLLGPAMVKGGMSQTTFTTPMSQFMIFLSPNEGLSTYDTSTPVVFRSSVPQGYAVVPVGNRMDGMDVKEKQVAVSDTVTSTYEVPLLNVPSFNNKTTEIRVNFAGELQGLKAKAYIKPRTDGATQIKVRFDDMKMAPKEKRFVLWAVSPEKQYTKIGQVINTGERAESEIRGETALNDFGLFVTVEEADVTSPTGTVYTPIVVGAK